MDWLTILQQESLPVVAAWVDEHGQVQATFERPLTWAEWYKFLECTNPTAARQAAAKSNAALATALKGLTPQQAVDYIDTNVKDLASAKAAMKLIVRILIALLNHVMPDLE